MRPLRPIPIAALAALLAGPAAGSPFHQRFDGDWVGSGTVQRASDSTPRRVTCTVRGAGDEARIALAGRCRAALVFVRTIGADLAVDPRTGRYRGVYVGSADGPAELVGERSGDVMRLAVQFPDARDARMEIRNPADADRFQLVVTAEVDGARRELTNLVFERR